MKSNKESPVGWRIQLGAWIAAILPRLLIVPAVLLSVANAQTIDGSFNAPNTEDDTTWNIRSMAMQADGKIVLIRSVSRLGVVSEPLRVVRLNNDGTIDRSFNSNLVLAAPPVTWAIYHNPAIVQAGEKILVSDAINYGVMGEANSSLARLNSNGSTDTAFSTPIRHAFIHNIKIQRDGKMFVAGNLQNVDAVSVSPDCGISTRIFMRLTANGEQDVSFCSPLTGVFAAQGAVALQNDGRILVAGRNDTSSVRYFSRLNVDGTLDESYNVPPATLSGGPDSPTAIAIQKDGKVLVAGTQFTNEGRACAGISRLNEDGSLDLAFATSGVYCYPQQTMQPIYRPDQLQLQADGKILYLHHVDSRKYISRLNDDGSQDSEFRIDETTSATTRFLLQDDGKLLLATDNDPSNGGLSRFYRVLNNSATSVLASNELVITWTRGGAAPELSRVIFESSTDGVRFSFLGFGSRVSSAGNFSNWQLREHRLPANTLVRARGFYSASSRFNLDSESVVESNTARVERTLCAYSRRSGPPCRRLAIRVFRYRFDPQSQSGSALPLQIHDAVVYVADDQGNKKTIVADKFSDYVFDEAIEGNTYKVFAEHAIFQFDPEIITIKEDTKELDFFAK
jgi:uncharacterized delta-60 repeat protein